MLIDMHCHIDVYSDKIKEIINRAKEKRVEIIINNGVDIKSNRKTLELSKIYPEIKTALGLYPINALSLNKKEIQNEITFIENNKGYIVMIGEVGIDLKESNDLESQSKIFEKFINLALKINKPITVHSRNAEKECIEILESLKAKKVLMHCFSGGMKLIKRIIENGWYLSIPSSVKYNEHFQKIIELVPIENLFCETDSPYLHPNREKNNEPMNVIDSYKKIAEIKGLNVKEVEIQIFKNYEKLMNIKKILIKNISLNT